MSSSDSWRLAVSEGGRLTVRAMNGASNQSATKGAARGMAPGFRTMASTPVTTATTSPPAICR